MPRQHRRILLAAVLFSLAGPAVACSTASTVAPGGSGTPVTGGDLKIGLTADPTCLDPAQSSQLSTLDISRSLVDTLTDQDPRTGRIVPWLATSFAATDGARKFTFTLRQGPTFSNGTPVDAEAVKATFDRLATFPGTGSSSYLVGYTGTTVTDARHVTVTFASPNAQFLQATSTAGFGIMSTSSAARSPQDRCRGDFVGSGPFVLDHYTANQDVVLRKRASYAWPSSLSPNRGAAHLDRVTFLFVPDGGARTTALRSGQIQVAENVQPTDQDQFTGGGFHLLVRSLPGLVPPMSLNQSGILGDERVRRALLTGINRTELVDSVLNHSYRPATGPLSSTTPFYVNTGAELAYDPAHSRSLLDAAGWRSGPDGVRVKNGKQLALDWLIPAPLPLADQYVQQQLRKIGVLIKLDVVPAARYVEQQAAGSFDISSVGVSRADPDVLRAVFSSAGANLWHLPHSRLDTYLDQEAAATSDAARKAAVTNAVKWIIGHADTVPLYENAQVHAVSDQVEHLVLDASARLDLHDAWLG
jgi:peptide/nickel transport system substrate-binding protein